MDKANAGKVNANKKKKTLRRAQRWGSGMLRMALHLAGLMAAVIVMGLIFSTLQAIESAWLRVGLSAMLSAALLLLCMNDGLGCGARDAAASRHYDSLVTRGMPVSQKEDAACYHPLKAICAAAIVFAVPLALSLWLASVTKGYTYVLQDLPVWVTESYGVRGDVMGPLGAYMQKTSMEAIDWIRMVVRLPIMVFVNLFPDPLTMSGMIDRLSPALMMLYPLAYTAGYLRGPAANRRQEKANRRAKKLAVRKAQKKGLAAELTGSQTQVHSGHKPGGAHKKKELV